jgi:hypothetical protein
MGTTLTPPRRRTESEYVPTVAARHCAPSYGSTYPLLKVFPRGLQREGRRLAVNVFGNFHSGIGVGESSRGLARSISMLRPISPAPLHILQLRAGTELPQMFQRFEHLSDTNVFVSAGNRLKWSKVYIRGRKSRRISGRHS